MVLAHGIPIPIFFAGVALGTVMVDLATLRAARSSFAPIFALTTLALLVLLTFAANHMSNGVVPADVGWPFYALAALATLAMGLQTATLHRVSGLSVRTTYVTGVLTNLAQEVVRYLVLRPTPTGSQHADDGQNDLASKRRGSRSRIALLASVWSS